MRAANELTDHLARFRMGATAHLAARNRHALIRSTGVLAARCCASIEPSPLSLELRRIGVGPHGRAPALGADADAMERKGRQATGTPANPLDAPERRPRSGCT